MISFLFHLATLRKDRRAVTALEYGLIAAAIVAVGLSGFSLIGDSLANKVGVINAAMSDQAASPD